MIKSSARAKLLSIAAISAAAILALPSASFGAASRTWVSGVGDDANPCSRTAPCKTWAGAISKTAAGGEIDALDTGGFGAVTITKSITIDGSAAGGMASILAVGTNGVVVQAASTDNIILRNIAFEGLFTLADPASAGIGAVKVVSARSVTIEGVAIHNWGIAGVDVAGDSGVVGVPVHPRVVIQNSTIRNVSDSSILAPAPLAGVNVEAADGASTADVLIENSTITNSIEAVRSRGGSKVRIHNSTLFGNDFAYDMRPFGSLVNLGGIIESGNPKVHKLSGAFTVTPLVIKRGKSLLVGVESSAPAKYALNIINAAAKTVASVKGSMKVDHAAIKWNGKAGKVAPPKGLYTVQAVFTAEGQTYPTSYGLTIN